MSILSHEDIKSFVETQLSVWPLAKKNYDALSNVRRRKLIVGDMTVGLQFNPARIVSTGANIDAKAVSKRPCFLCRGNRPAEQHILNVHPDWEMLVNPYPIFPVHLTIVSKNHVPQSEVPFEIVSFAEMLPGMAVFFNGAKAGASAPDHLHLQAVLTDELPLLKIAESVHPSDKPGILDSDELNAGYPYRFFSGVVLPGEEGMKILLAGLRSGGLSEDGTFSDQSLVNTFFWKDNAGAMRFLVVPRRAHRPECYYAEGDANFMVSPGCIDMAGIIIMPRERDFDRITAEDIEKIYSQTAYGR